MNNNLKFTKDDARKLWNDYLAASDCRSVAWNHWTDRDSDTQRRDYEKANVFCAALRKELKARQSEYLELFAPFVSTWEEA